MYQITVRVYFAFLPEYTFRRIQDRYKDVELKLREAEGTLKWEAYAEFEDAADAILFKLRYSL